MTNSDLEVKIRELQELRSKQTILDEQIKLLESEIKSEMTERNEYQILGEDYKVTWNMVSSNRFSQKEFKDDHPDLYEKYMRVSESRRFLIS